MPGGNPYHDPRNGKFTSGPGGPGSGLSSMFGVRATGKVDSDGKAVYDFSERSDYVDNKLTEWHRRGVDTRELYKNKNGEWSASRQRQQQELMDAIWKERAAGVPNEGKALMAGGLGGAGKGYTLKNKVKVDESRYFTINPDDVKEAMAERGMIPKLDKNLTPMELSPLAHEEASEMANALANRAYREKKNVVWDITMSSEESVKDKRLDKMRSRGYTEINAVFVDVSVDKSVGQARSRWENGLTRYAEEGKGLGGRFLPSGASMGNRPSPGSFWRSKNREVFEAVKNNFDGYRVYDNEVGSTLIESKGKVVGGG